MTEESVTSWAGVRRAVTPQLIFANVGWSASWPARRANWVESLKDAGAGMADSVDGGGRCERGAPAGRAAHQHEKPLRDVRETGGGIGQETASANRHFTLSNGTYLHCNIVYDGMKCQMVYLFVKFVWSSWKLVLAIPIVENMSVPKRIQSPSTENKYVLN